MKQGEERRAARGRRRRSIIAADSFVMGDSSSGKVNEKDK